MQAEPAGATKEKLDAPRDTKEEEGAEKQRIPRHFQAPSHILRLMKEESKQ